MVKAAIREERQQLQQAKAALEKAECVSIPSRRGKTRSDFGLLSRDNRLRYQAFSRAVTTAEPVHLLFATLFTTLPYH